MLGVRIRMSTGIRETKIEGLKLRGGGVAYVSKGTEYQLFQSGGVGEEFRRPKAVHKQDSVPANGIGATTKEGHRKDQGL